MEGTIDWDLKLLFLMLVRHKSYMVPYYMPFILSNISTPSIYCQHVKYVHLLFIYIAN